MEVEIASQKSLFLFFHTSTGTWKLKQGADEDTRMIYSPVLDGYIAIDEDKVVITKVNKSNFNLLE